MDMRESQGGKKMAENNKLLARFLEVTHPIELVQGPSEYPSPTYTTKQLLVEVKLDFGLRFLDSPQDLDALIDNFRTAVVAWKGNDVKRRHCAVWGSV